MGLYQPWFAEAGDFSGTVRGKDHGNVLPGAHVWIETKRPKGVFCDAKGNFRITDIPAGKWLVKVTFLGYKPSEQWVVIHESGSTFSNFNLEIQPFEGQEVEIIDSRKNREVLNQPVRMEILSAQTIAANPGQNIVSALDVLSGVNMSSTLGIFSNNTIVSLRGLSGDDQGRTLVLTDDVPMNKADAGSVNWNLINRDNISSIEVIKGPGSILYGGCAMGGVINIRSLEPVKKLEAAATGTYGTFNTLGIRYAVGGKPFQSDQLKGLYWRLNGFYRRSDGYNPEIPEYLEPGDTFYVNNYLREISTSLKTGYRFNQDNSIEISAGFFNDKRGRGTEVYEIDGAFERHKTLMINTRYLGGWKKMKFRFLAFGNEEWFERLNEYMREGEYNLYLVESKRSDRGANFSTSMYLGDAHELTAGIDYRFGSVFGQDIYYTSTDLITNQGKMSTYAVFLQDDFQLFNGKLRFVGGLRLNYATFFEGKFRIDDPSYSVQYLVDYQDSAYQSSTWAHVDPKISVQYRWSPTTRLYLSFARGFRAPALDDLCRTGKMRNGFKVANPDLKPEILDNIEIGGDMRFFNIAEISFSAFRSYGKDFLYYVSTGDSVNMGYKLTPVYKKNNISMVEITGLELETTVDPLPWLSVFANYTYNHSVIHRFEPLVADPDKDLTGNYLTNVPEHKVAAGLTCKNRLVNFNLIWKYIGERYINDENETDFYLQSATYPAYQTFGLKLWHILKKHYTFAFSMDNIFNERFIDDRLQQSPGRQFTFEFNVSF
jgi:iron complex outermembrane receptor protein